MDFQQSRVPENKPSRIHDNVITLDGSRIRFPRMRRAPIFSGSFWRTSPIEDIGFKRESWFGFILCNAILNQNIWGFNMLAVLTFSE